jgi:tyrosyl-tRNA synthetase
MTQTPFELTGFFREAMDRGFVHQITGSLSDMHELFQNPVTGYIGFDCTADGLHVGNLASLMLLRLFKRHGHRPLVLLGGGTSRVGDPSGKTEARQMLTNGEIDKNMNGIEYDVRRFVSDAEIVDNRAWLSRLDFLDFLVSVGQHFSVNRLLTHESIRSRLNNQQNLSFMEFTYALIQAYDFVQLNTVRNCVLQMGGSDQWGNIVAGIELGRRMHDVSLFGLTTPLITTANGEKMGKTAKGAVWLSYDKLSPFDYYQFWRNTADEDVIWCLKMFTEIPVAEIDERYGYLSGKDINEAKIRLAAEATKLAHGEQAAYRAAGAAVNAVDEGLPLTEIILSPQEKVRLADVFVRAGLVSSISAARRLARDGGAYLFGDHGPVALDEDRVMEPAGFHNAEIKIGAGKKRMALVRFSVR